MTTETIPTEAVPPEAVPPVPAELRERIAALTAEAQALFPVVAKLSEQAMATRQEYRALVDALGVHDIGEVVLPPGFFTPDAPDAFGSFVATWPASDYVTYRDGLDGMGDAVFALMDALATVFDSTVV